MYLELAVTCPGNKLLLLKYFSEVIKVMATKCYYYSSDWFQSMRMPIHWAASGGHTEMVEYLLNFNVPVDVRDEVNRYFLSPILCWGVWWPSG